MKPITTKTTLAEDILRHIENSMNYEKLNVYCWDKLLGNRVFICFRLELIRRRSVLILNDDLIEFHPHYSMQAGIINFKTPKIDLPKYIKNMIRDYEILQDVYSDKNLFSFTKNLNKALIL